MDFINNSYFHESNTLRTLSKLSRHIIFLSSIQCLTVYFFVYVFSGIMTQLKKTHNKTLMILIAYAWTVNATRPPTVTPVHVPQAYKHEVLAAIQFNYNLLVKANITSESGIALDSVNVIWTWDKIYGKLREVRTTSKRGICWNWTEKKGRMFVHYFSVYNVFCKVFPAEYDIEQSFVGDTASFLDDEMMFKNLKKDRVNISKVWEREEKRLNESSSESEEVDESESGDESESE